MNEMEKYSYYYPHYLEWERASWVVQVGDYLKKSEKLYRIVQVNRSPVPGSTPIVCVEPDEQTK